MGLRDIEATLPPGFKFYPSDEELVCHYLYKKIANERTSKGTLVEIDLHTCEPWQLPDVAKLGNNEWYFFSFRDRKYATGLRTNRATTSGYWKATGKDRMIFDPTTKDIVGMRKTLVFYLNRAPQGIKTGWVMHEFRLENPHMPPKEDWVLCRVMNKSKGQPSTEFRLENVLETTMGLSSPNLASSSPTDQTRPTAFQQLSSFYQVSEHCNNPTLNPNVLEYSQQGNSTPIVDINSKGGDEYGFLLNMSFDDNNLEDGGPAMKFEDDSSIVFL